MEIKFSMRLKKAISSLVLALLLLSPVVTYAIEDEMKTVLILNSYHHGFTWTREETEGALSVFLDNKEYISIDIEYMDWKNHPTQENLNYLYDITNINIDQKRLIWC